MAFKKSFREKIKDLQPFDPNASHTNADLELYATRLLLGDEGVNNSQHDGGPLWLHEEQIESRKKKEIYTTIGTPDPEIVQGCYNRTHPLGRKVNSKEQRSRNGAAFYR